MGKEKSVMVERLIKVLTPNECYFIKTYLSSGDRVLRVSINALAKELQLSAGTIHDALRILEVGGCILTEKSYKCTVIIILRRDRLKEIAKAYDNGEV